MINSANIGRADIKLFWISCIMLFFELLLIRWLSAEIRIFSYFHNLVLLFCFLGIGLGCGQPKETNILYSLLPLSIVVLFVSLGSHIEGFSLQNLSRDLSLGTNFIIWDRQITDRWDVALKALLKGTGLMFLCSLLLTAVFFPLGQILGQLFRESQKPLRAYGINILGSLVGVWWFTALSVYHLPPAIWFIAAGLACLPFVKKPVHAIVILLVVILLGWNIREDHTEMKTTIWSPYQKLDLQQLYFAKGPHESYGYSILVNSTGYMMMTNYSPEFTKRFPSFYPEAQIPYDQYNIPYRFVDRADNVLIVGAGGGNDVAGALRNNAQHVTAVEIDPVIIQLGRKFHPEAPYSNPRVQVVNDDARSFFKKGKEKYDLIIFGLLDSHTLSSSYSNVRLDNYVYTRESFQEAKRLLKPNGILMVSFGVSDDFIGARLEKMLTDVFGHRPIGFNVAFRDFRGWGGVCFVTGDAEMIRQKMAQDPQLERIVKFAQPVFDRWASWKVEMTKDDWPYLYLSSRAIPKLYFIIFGLLFLFSYFGIRKTVGFGFRIQRSFFFLGAGFLLLEVQNISKFALLFGTTWTVNTIIISAVLLMIFLANYVALLKPPASLRWCYVALFASLATCFVIPLDIFAQLPPLPKGLFAGIFMSVPIFFAGIIFSTSFARTDDQAGAFASNLLGAMAGGVAECLSFVIGIRALLVIAAVFYFCSMNLGQLTRSARLKSSQTSDI